MANKNEQICGALTLRDDEILLNRILAYHSSTIYENISTKPTAEKVATYLTLNELTLEIELAQSNFSDLKSVFPSNIRCALNKEKIPPFTKGAQYSSMISYLIQWKNQSEELLKDISQRRICTDEGEYQQDIGREVLFHNEYAPSIFP